MNKVEFMNIYRKLEKFSKPTISHMIRVGKYAEQLGRILSLTEEEVNILLIGGTFHDIGKSLTPESILNKSGRLTDSEFEQMKKHTSDGFDLYKSIFNLNDNIHKEVSDIILYHHENLDGSGYHGLKNNEIPLLAQIVSICDFFDAMTEHRVYRPGLPLHIVFSELNKNKGVKFNSTLVNTFMDGIQTGKIAFLIE